MSLTLLAGLDLTPYAGPAASLILVLWLVYDRLKAGRRAQRDGLNAEIAAAVESFRTRAENAEALLKTRGEEISDYQRRLRDAEAREGRLEQAVKEGRVVADELQRQLLKALGDVDVLEKRLSKVEDENGSHR